MKLVGYARVSKSEQAENSNALEQQQHRLKKAGAEEIYTDVQSGRCDDRPAMDRLLNLIRQGRVTAVVVTRFDRIARSARFNYEIMKLLEDTGVLLKVLDEGDIDFASPHAWKRTQQAGIDAEFESRMLSKRVRDGYAFLREEKKASPRIPYGYRRVNECYQLDLEVHHIARAAIELYLELRSLPSVCREVYQRYGKSWSVTGLRNWLMNPVLVGHTPYNQKHPRNVASPQSGEIIYHTHPDQALMLETEQQEILQILQENIRLWGANSKQNVWCNPLGGLIFCGGCGHTVDILGKPSGGKATPKRRIRYAYCRVRGKKFANLTCDQKSTVKFEVIEQAVIDAIVSAAQTIAEIADASSPQVEPVELKELRSQLAGLESLGYNQAIEAAKQNLRVQIENLAHKLQFDSAEFSGNRELLLEVFRDIDFWMQLPPDKRRRVYQKLVGRVVILDGAISSVVLKL
jgi:DNA invertase Pin-like site-specific DNA recombinase